MAATDPQHALAIGERLRAARLQQKLSLRDLAERVDLSASMLSQIETGKSSPSVRSIHNIAIALGVRVDYLFPEQDAGQPTSPDQGEGVIDGMTTSDMRQVAFNRLADDDEIESFWPMPSRLRVVRASTRPTIKLEGDVIWSRLTYDAEADAEFLEITYPPSSSSSANLSHHDGREFGLILEGELVVQLGFDQVTLYEGDSLVFDSRTPHRMSNTTERVTRALWVIRSRAS
jgi:transcriptional regulator with XRE-family HTH domain